VVAWLGFLYSCECYSPYGSLLAMVRGFKGAGQFVFGPLECTANTADTAETKDNENSNDSTNCRPYAGASCSGGSVGLLSLRLGKLKAEGVNISAESLFQISL